MTEELVVLDTVSGRIQGELIQSYLEANGIRCMLSQEAAGWVHGLTVGELARVEILVPASQLEEARIILNEYHAAQAVGES